MSHDTVWVCTKCGRWSKTRTSFDDESCYVNAIKVKKSLCEFSESGWLVTRIAKEKKQ